MCGIFGIVSPDKLTEPKALLEEMTDLLVHRGPDGRGSYMEDTVFLGHRRLSIIDLAGGAQPMQAGDGRYTVTYNGEIYNFKIIRDNLAAKGHSFQTHCDTEVLLRAYMEYGESCVDHFVGMFAFAIWDKRERTLFLCRDRLGIKPLYYAMLGKKLIFASEMKSILRHPEFVRRPNIEALSSYLTFRTVVGERSVFQGIHILMPGHTMTYRSGEVRIRQYWDVPIFERKEDRGEDYYLAEVKKRFRLAVERRMISDVPLGAYLSGGLDSSLMVAVMSEMQSQPVKTFSIGFDVEGYDEGKYAKIVADAFKTDHKQVVLKSHDYAAMMEKMIRHRDQPLSIPHETALFLLSVELKKDITVCLSGEGADELFGGYGRVQRSPMDWKKIAALRKLPSPLQSVVKSFIRNADTRKRMELGDDCDHFFHVYNWWPFEEKWDMFTADANAAINRDANLIGIFKNNFERMKNCDVYDRVFYIFQKIHLLNLLDRLDVQSMAASVEARVPFVDHELVEFVSAIPVHHKMRWKSPLHRLRAVFMSSSRASENLDINKYLLRRYSDEVLPREIARRKKLGFPVPLDVWLGGALQKFSRDILLDDRTRRRGLFRPDKVEALLNNPQSLDYDFYGKRIWMMINIELWHRMFIDRS